LPNKSVCAPGFGDENRRRFVNPVCLQNRGSDSWDCSRRGSIACSSRRGRRSKAGTNINNGERKAAFLGRHDLATADSMWESSGSRSSTARAGLVSECFPFNKGLYQNSKYVYSVFPKKGMYYRVLPPSLNNCRSHFPRNKFN
jgi:hypothetical protein